MSMGEVYVLMLRDDNHEWNIHSIVTSKDNAIAWKEYWPEIREYEHHEVVSNVPIKE